MAYQYQQLHHMEPQHYYNPPTVHGPEKLTRATSAPYGSSSHSSSGTSDQLQHYMKDLSSRRGEFVTGGSKSYLKPTLSSTASTTTATINGRRDEMVAGNTYVYPRVIKGSNARSNSTSQSRMYVSEHYSGGGSHRHTSTSSHRHHGHSSRSSPNRERQRRRSVSPQMQRKLELSPPSSLPVIESPSSESLPPAPPHKKKFVKKAINMMDVRNRVKTFERMPKWEADDVNYHSIASAGLYFTGQEDITRCCECDVVLSDWSAHDDPLEVHFNENPNCIYLRKNHAKVIEDLCSSKFNTYESIDVRVKSFGEYPCYTIDVPKLASSGFFYTGINGKTQCFACGFVKSDWSEDDDVIAIHRNFYRECPHLKEMESQSDRMLHTSAPPTVNEMRVPGNEVAGLKRPDYSSTSVRLLSFKHYSSHVIDKEDFVDAGFFLLSQPQTVKCFACNLVLDRWSVGESPLKKHYRFNPSCPFLQGSDISIPSSSPPPNSSSFPAPIFSYNEMVNKFKGASVANGHTAALATEHRQEEMTKERDATTATKPGQLFNLPIHLPPKYKKRGASTISSSPPYHTYPSTESSNPSTPSDETFRSLNEDDKLCIICFDKPKEYAIVPCGHLCSCADCSGKLRNCPVCRKPKQSVIRIYNT